jgi:hypothetical protein
LTEIDDPQKYTKQHPAKQGESIMEKTSNILWKEAEHKQPQSIPEPAPVDQLPPGADNQSHQIDPEIVAIESAVGGVHLYDGDPELSQIVRNQGVRAFYKSVEAAVAAKNTRINAMPIDMPARQAWQGVEHKKNKMEIEDETNKVPTGNPSVLDSRRADL